MRYERLEIEDFKWEITVAMPLLETGERLARD